MRILVVCQHYWPEPFNVAETCSILRDLGHEVVVVTGLPNCPQGYVLDEYRNGRNRRQVIDSIEIRRAWLIPRGENLEGFNKAKRIANYFSFAIAASSRKLVNDIDFDVVLCIQFSPVLMAYPALRHSKRRGKPCIVYSYDLWPEDLLTGGLSRTGLPYNIMKYLSKRIYSSSDAIAITSPDFQTYFEDELGITEKPYFYLPQYAEEQFEVIGQARNAARESTEITFAGNIGGNQSIENVVRAAALTKGKANVRINIIGSGSKLDECRHLADELEADNVVFYGRQPFENMPQYYSQADAMLLSLASPSNDSKTTTYTIPRKLQSYLAAGKPVICSADGIAARIVSENRLGLTCAADNPYALADTFISFAAIDEDARNAMAEASRDYYLKEFSRKSFAVRIDELLKQVTK